MFYSDPVNNGNPLLQPEELLSFEWGMEYKTKHLTSGLTYFQDYGNNVIDWIMLESSGVYEAGNIAKIQTNGIEMRLGYNNATDAGNFILKRFFVNYAFTNSYFSEGNYESKYAGDFLKHKFALSSIVQLTSNIQIDYRLSYSSRNGSYADFDEINGIHFSSPFEAYWMNDLSISYKRASVKVYLKVSNLFDVEYNDIGNLVQPGRWISAGFDFKLEKLYDEIL